MEEYPDDYVSPARPLVVLSGLVKAAVDDRDHELQRNGPMLSSEAPVATGNLAQELLDVLIAWNITHTPTSEIVDAPSVVFKTCGRQYAFPCTKANPRPSPVSSPKEASKGFGSSAVLHSPLSPLSPGSPNYPDGLLNPLWNAKYQKVVPSVFISFYAFGSHSTQNALRDGQLKDEITRTKSFFENSSYRTRFVVVLVGDDSALDTHDADERLESIRQGAKLDSKGTFHVIPPGASSEELSELAGSLITSIRPLASEFYRDLARHARRKRDKGYTPPLVTLPDGRVQPTLSASGWVTRYEYKLGIFAEYRGELDLAERSFVSVIDGLYEAQGLLETTSCWSSRWNELRLFTDTCNLRLIRCLLSSGQSVAAVRRWRVHRIQTHWLLNRRGKGTISYGWNAWESRWAKVMGQLVRDSLSLTEIISKNESISGPTGFPAYAAVAVAQSYEDRPLPWEFAHHAGYWFFLSSEFMRARRGKAQSIPESDRLPPGQSPASSVARQNELYDTYLCPEPYLEYPSAVKGAINHTQLIVNLLDEAVAQFRTRGQISMADRLDLTIGEELIQKSRHTEALLILKPIWRRGSWRKAQWWKLSTELVWALHQCATGVGDVEVILATHWELLNGEMLKIADLSYDFHAAAKEVTKSTTEQASVVAIHLSDGIRASPIKADFLFETAECHASDVIRAQLTITSYAHFNTRPITLSSIAVSFSGALQTVSLLHSPSLAVKATQSPLLDYSTIDPKQTEEADQSDAKRYTAGVANLTLSPGQTRVFGLSLSPRETGSVHLQSIVATVQTESLNMTIPMQVNPGGSSAVWYCIGSHGVRKKRVASTLASTKVLPRQPRLDIKLRNINKQYFTNEKVVLEIELVNNESEAADATLDVQVLGGIHDPPRYAWNAVSGATLQAKALSIPLDILPPSQKTLKSVVVQMPSIASDLRLQVHTTYRLASSPDGSIVKSFSTDLSVIGPFEANYDLSAAVHPDPWPSFFDMGDEENNEKALPDHSVAASALPKLSTRWNLKASIASFATETLLIEKTEVRLLEVHSKTTCTVHEGQANLQEAPIGSKEQRNFNFTIDSNSELEAKKAAEIEASLLVYWRRTSGQSTFTNCTTLAVPSLNLNSNEPRILATVQRPSGDETIILEYTFENPSMHLLLLSSSMDTSGEYAFSGPKQTTFQLLPISRHRIRYVLQPLIYGVFIQPQLKVMDTYFKQILQPIGTGGLKGGANGILLWVDAIA